VKGHNNGIHETCCLTEPATVVSQPWEFTYDCDKKELYPAEINQQVNNDKLVIYHYSNQSVPDVVDPVEV